MKPFVVIHILDEKGKSILDIFQCSVFPEIDFLDLEGFKKTLGGGIIVWISFTGHADPEAVFQ